MRRRARRRRPVRPAAGRPCQTRWLPDARVATRHGCRSRRLAADRLGKRQSARPTRARRPGDGRQGEGGECASTRERGGSRRPRPPSAHARGRRRPVPPHGASGAVPAAHGAGAADSAADARATPWEGKKGGVGV
ncbi:hypothetical protein BU14_0056s0005 [Porphyra umbilicalis]|uniref:Uncharacterized protein n=1 Tax=Porphyra umbilicalis TaxID=2786 RepID=A0A1X6PH72_PORUM|nr:hypothetical protein BU14_0056s0005 [Porphyra umbilicalis]|eukprot:OSX80221.1 hypothetical protein BU14_0056s0005 [Porphyra umbilicalis]